MLQAQTSVKSCLLVLPWATGPDRMGLWQGSQLSGLEIWAAHCFADRKLQKQSWDNGQRTEGQHQARRDIRPQAGAQVSTHLPSPVSSTMQADI